jgi:hypothetical protein
LDKQCRRKESSDTFDQNYNSPPHCIYNTQAAIGALHGFIVTFMMESAVEVGAWFHKIFTRGHAIGVAAWVFMMGDNSTRLINNTDKVVEIREFRVLHSSPPLDCNKDTIYRKIILQPNTTEIVKDPRAYRESHEHTGKVSLLMIFCDGSYEEMKPLSAQDFIGSKTITITKQDQPDQNSTEAVQRRFVVRKEPRQIVSQGQTTPIDRQSLSSAASYSGRLTQERGTNGGLSALNSMGQLPVWNRVPLAWLSNMGLVS